MKRIISVLILLLFSHTSFSNKLSSACANKKIIAYTKTKCIYCIKLKTLLSEIEIPFEEIDVTKKPLMINWLISTTKAYTVPYIFIGDEYIGGYTDFLKICIEGKK